MLMNQDRFKYWAFISYSHRDSSWGKWLHTALETYRVPRKLVGAKTSIQRPPKRIYPVFRDREELPTSSDLSRNIQTALEQSRFLIVICSPHSAESIWVNQEVKLFKSIGRDDRILCLIIDGEPNASAKPATTNEECFCEALRYRVDEKAHITSEPTEPIAADVRRIGDGRHNALLKLVAGLLGVNYNALKQRDKIRRRTKRILWATSVFLLTFCFLTTWYWQEARRAADVGLTQAKEYGLNGLALLDKGDRYGALVWFTEALRRGAFDPRQEELFRIRIAALFQSTPRLCQQWVLPGVFPTAAFSPDGEGLLLTRGNSVEVYHTGTRDLLLQPLEHDGLVQHATFSHNGKMIASTSADKKVHIWDAQCGRPICNPLQFSSRVDFCQFSPDDQRILICFSDNRDMGEARVFDIKTRKPVTMSMNDYNAIHRARFSPDGRKIVGACQTGAARLWDATNGRDLRYATRIGKNLLDAGFGPTGKRIVLAGNNIAGQGFAQVWDDRLEKSLGSLMIHDAQVNAAGFDVTGRFIITASHDGSFRLWDGQSGKPLESALQQGNPVVQAEFCHDKRQLLTTTRECVRIWDYRLGQPHLEFRTEDPILDAVYSPDGGSILTATRSVSGRGETRLWDAQTGQPISDPVQHDSAKVRALFSQNGRHYLTFEENGNVQVWNVQTGEPVGVRVLTGVSIRTARLSSDGRRIVTAAADNTASVWNVQTGKRVMPPMKFRDHLYSAKFSPDGAYVIATSRDKGIWLWDAKTGRRVEKINWDDRAAIFGEFSDDGRRLMTADEEIVCVWDVQSGAAVGSPIASLDGIVCATIRPDGRAVLIINRAKEIRVWDVVEGQPITGVMRHPGGIHQAAFSRDGRWIVTTGADQSARLWDAMSGLPITPPLHHEWYVGAASFDPDGRYLLTLCGRSVRVWCLQPDRRPARELAQLAQLMSGRNIDSSGRLRPLSSEALDELWSDLSERHPTWFDLRQYHPPRPTSLAEDEEKELLSFWKGKMNPVILTGDHDWNLASTFENPNAVAKSDSFISSGFLDQQLGTARSQGHKLREAWQNVSKQVPRTILSIKDFDTERNWSFQKEADFKERVMKSIGATSPGGTSLPPPEAEDLPALIHKLHDRDYNIRRQAAADLGRMGPKAKDAGNDLIKTLTDPDRMVRYEAVTALVKIEPETDEAIPALLKSCRDEDSGVRAHVIWALGRIGTKTDDIVPALIEMSDDPSHDVRAQVMWAFGWMRGRSDSAIPALVMGLNDKKPNVRSTAAWALGRMGSKAKSAIASLKEARLDDDPHVQKAADEALREIEGN